MTRALAEFWVFAAGAWFACIMIAAILIGRANR